MRVWPTNAVVSSIAHRSVGEEAPGLGAATSDACTIAGIANQWVVATMPAKPALASRRPRRGARMDRRARAGLSMT
ncbi:MAG: hypothetical protein ACK55O_13220, partial [Phycisphaerales bacterium]